MSNENLIKVIKVYKAPLISIGTMAISTILVGMSLFDRNYKLGKTGFMAATMGFTVLASASLFFVLSAVKEVNSKLKEINARDLNRIEHKTC